MGKVRVRAPLVVPIFSIPPPTLPALPALPTLRVFPDATNTPPPTGFMVEYETDETAERAHGGKSGGRLGKPEPREAP